MPARAALAVAFLAGSLAASAPAASAATYSVSPCSAGVSTPPQLSFFQSPVRSRLIFSAQDGCAGGGQMFIEGNNENFGATTGERAEWKLTAPSFSEIKKIEEDEFFFGGPEEDNSPDPWEHTDLAWIARANGTQIQAAGHFQGGSRNVVPAPGTRTFEAGVNGVPTGIRELTNVIECNAPSNGQCPFASHGEIAAETTSLVVDMTDNGMPTVSAEVGGSLLAQPDRAHGIGEVTFSGFDRETGVFTSKVLVDGQLLAEKHVDPNSNGGKCNQPFHSFVPCLSDASFAYRIDTTSLADGPHTLAVVVCDATSVNCATSQAFPFTVRNAPTNTTPPSIAGAAKPGSQLTATSGAWAQADQSPFSFSYQWLRCPGSVSAPTDCAPIAGAVSPSYTLTAADLGKREIVEVTAKLDAATHQASAAFSAPSDVVSEAGSGGARPPQTPGGGHGPGGGHAPQTSLSKHPRKKTSSGAVKFAFTSSQAGAHFECRLDKGRFKPCRSPFKKKKLKPGAHVFRVRAVNAAGEPDATPALFRWKVL